jgi:hypothetical protein
VLFDRLGAVADNEVDVLSAKRGCTVDDMLDHWLARDLMHYLRKIRIHSRAFAGG